MIQQIIKLNHSDFDSFLVGDHKEVCECEKLTDFSDPSCPEMAQLLHEDERLKKLKQIQKSRMKLSADLDAISHEANDGEMSSKALTSLTASNGLVLASFEEMKQ